ncbi:DUF418 domain-containing protein [Trueperella pecoris]|uniref:DUF418 domain-containing protein n=1 Tax=Trueperella pecoris TaxID=2733571 RepID=UPI00186B8830|nr:heparan-alpha-glucosaminide N-acetyltransferase domain-containing protein [Trueperella pecoris]QOQ39675.1 DUF1624 domain-containing protein [Trueperella pecoris]
MSTAFTTPSGHHAPAQTAIAETAPAPSSAPGTALQETNTGPAGGPRGTARRYTGRIRGIDVARGLAILGMIWAHVRPAPDDWGTIAHFLSEIPSGRSSALFALLAGVSLAILTGRNVHYTGEQMRHAQLRIAGRAVALLVFAAFLNVFSSMIAIILGFYAAWFLFAIPLVDWSAKKLAIAAGVVALVGPQIIIVFNYFLNSHELYGAGGLNAFLIDALSMGSYPGLAYMAYVLAGMAIGRMDLTCALVRTRLFVVGASLAVTGYGTAALATRTFAYPHELGIEILDEFSPAPPQLSDFFMADPHLNTTTEVLGNLGVALAVIAVCLWLSPLAKHVLYPVAAVGSMSLTAYVGHAFGLHFKPEWFFTDSFVPFLVVAGLVIVFSTVWALLPFRRGPLEWVMYRFSQWFALPDAVRPAAPLVTSAAVTSPAAPIDPADGTGGRAS